MIDFSKMSGYEFELFVKKLFLSLGFNVEHTDFSNDGGVDLIATNDELIYTGKYIIQCKNWSSNVGQPELRDLFGVVTDTRANKGILITPSDFTDKAYEFAKNKNLELINGQKLRELISLAGIDNQDVAKNSCKSNDLYYKNERYSYLKNRIDREPKDDSLYRQMYEYLFSFVINQDEKACTFELMDEIIFWLDRVVEKCYKSKTKSNIEKKREVLIRKSQVYLRFGKLVEATEILLSINSFYMEDFICFIQRWKHTYNISDTANKYIYKDVHKWNLYVSYEIAGCEIAKRIIMSKLASNEDCTFISAYSLNDMYVDIKKKLQIGFYETPILDDESILHPTSANFYQNKFYTKSGYEYDEELLEVFKNHGIA